MSTGSYLCGELLKTPDIDGAFLRSVQVAAAHAEIRGRTHHSASETERVVGEDELGRAVVVLLDSKRTNAHLTGYRILNPTPSPHLVLCWRCR